MVQLDIEKIDDTLPYGANSEDVSNLIDAIKIKIDNDKGIKQVYGKPNIENARKILKVIGISDDGLSFTAEGREYAYETNPKEKQLLLLKLLLNFPAYEYFLLNISNNKLSETSLEEIQGYWGKNSYGTSEYNRNDASSTFAKLIELAGLGTFKLGRKGKQSRIEWNSSAEKLIRDTHQLATSKCNEGVNNIRLSQAIDREISNINTDLWFDDTKTSELEKAQSNYNGKTDETELVKEVLEKSFSSQQQKNSLSKIDISVNIDMTNWEIDKITSFFKATQGIFEESDEL